MNVIGLLVNLISGAIGGNILGAAWKEKSLGAIGNSIAGLIGGAAGSYILQAVGLLNTMGLGDITAGALLSGAGVSAVSGAILTGIVGLIKSKMNKP